MMTTKGPEDLIQDLDQAIKSDDERRQKEAARGIIAMLLRDLNQIANAAIIIAHHLGKDK